MQTITLMREILRKGLDEGFPAVGKAELLPVERHHIIAVGVKTTQTDIVEYSQIAQQAIKHLTFIDTAYKVHTCLELHALTTETLQTTTYLRSLFEDGDVVAVATENQSTRQAAKPTSDNDHTLSAHRLCSSLLANW